MAKKTLLIGSVLAAALLAGCSGTNNGGNDSASSSTTSTTSSTSSSASSSMAPGPETESSDESSSGSVEAAELDDQSATWFTTFCGALAGIQTSAESAAAGATEQASPDMSPAEGQTTMATLYTELVTGIKDAAATIESAEPPTFPGGDQLATGIVTAFNGVGDSLETAVDQFASAPVTDAASLQAAQTALETAFGTSFTQIGSSLQGMEAAVTPEIAAAAEALPGCEILQS